VTRRAKLSRYDLCNKLKLELKDELLPGDVGEFIREWASLEVFLD